GPLAAPDQRVERGKEIQGHEHGAALEELAVVDGTASRKPVLQLPGESDALVVVRAPRPARIPPAHDRLPETREPLGEAVEGRAEPGHLDEGQGIPLPSDAARGRPAESHVPGSLEILAGGRPGGRGCGHTRGANQSNTSPCSPTRYSTISSLMALPRCLA